MYVLGAERTLPNGEGAFVKRFGFGIATLCPVEQREVVKISPDNRMSGPNAFSLMARARSARGSASA